MKVRLKTDEFTLGDLPLDWEAHSYLLTPRQYQRFRSYLNPAWHKLVWGQDEGDRIWFSVKTNPDFTTHETGRSRVSDHKARAAL